MIRLAEKVQEWMGWCPNTMPDSLIADPGSHPDDLAANRSVRPGLPEAYQLPDRFTALSIVILHAVEILLVSGKTVRIGMDEPDTLAGAINRAIR